MPRTSRRCMRRQARRGSIRTDTVVTNPVDCCVPPESLTEEIYAGSEPAVLIQSCCDNRINGCREYDTRSRCPYWPKFAHPRWLNCDELHSRKT